MPLVRGKFTDAHKRISVYVGDLSPRMEIATVYFTAYDHAGVQVGEASDTVGSSPPGVHTKLSVQSTSATPDIEYFEIKTLVRKRDVAIDELSFDNPSTPGSRSFNIAWTHEQAPSGEVILRPGGAPVHTSVQVDRFNMSRGRLHFDVDASAAPGIEATVSPNDMDAPDGTRIGISLKARAGTPLTSPRNVTVTATALEPASSGFPGPPVPIPVEVLGGPPNLRVTGLEVTQAVQYDLNGPFPARLFREYFASFPADWGGLPSRSGGARDPVEYVGVRLVAHRRTIVRAFVGAAAAPFVGSVMATLSGTDRDGNTLPGSPLLPDGKQAMPIAPGPAYTQMNQRADPNGGYTFTLPNSWASGVIALTAAITFEGFTFDAPCICESFTLDKIAFTPTRGWDIAPYLGRIAGDPAGPPAGPSAVFNDTATILPLGEGQLTLPTAERAISVCPAPIVKDGKATAVPCTTKADPTSIPYLVGEISITDIAKCTDPAEDDCDESTDKAEDVMDRLIDHEEDTHDTGDTSVVVVSGLTGGIGGLSLTDQDTAGKEEYPLAVVRSLDAKRGLTSDAHEIGHGLGLPHAGTSCPGAETGFLDFPTGNTGAKWPPDDKGYLQGIGIDPRPGSGKAVSAPYKLFVPGKRPAGDGQYYDFMSYCTGGDDSTAWISTRNWDALVGVFTSEPAVSARASAGRSGPRTVRLASSSGGDGRTKETVPKLFVVADVKPSGEVEIDHIRKAIGAQAAPDSDPPSDFHLVARDARGLARSEIAMINDGAHIHGAGQIGIVRGVVPARGVMKIEVKLDGKVMAALTRSSHSPTVRIIAPRQGATVGRERTTTLRWHARDDDHDPLALSVDYSYNGRTWNNIYVGPNRDRLALPSVYFSASRRGRVRVRANDGFNETAAVSARFRAVGSAPGVVITSPSRGLRLQNDAPLYLAGQAYDDLSRPLRGRHLRWFVGRRLVGRGAALSVSGLPSGFQHITLVARDGRGRESRISTFVRLLAAKPQFLRLRVQKGVTRSSRRVRLRVRTTIPATLRVGAQHFVTGRKSRTVSVRIRPGRSKLQLRLHLIAGGKVRQLRLSVPRR